MWLVSWMRNRGIKVSWYDWLIVIVGLFVPLFTIQNYFAALYEFESGTASTFLMATRIPSLVLNRHYRSAGLAAQQLHCLAQFNQS